MTGVGFGGPEILDSDGYRGHKHLLNMTFGRSLLCLFSLPLYVYASALFFWCVVIAETHEHRISGLFSYLQKNGAAGTHFNYEI